MDEGRSTVGGNGGERNSFRPAGGTVNHSKEVCVTGGRGERANQINMNVRKPLSRNRNMLRRDVGVAVDFGSLTGETGATPGSDVTGKVWPDITRGNEAAGGTNTRMCQVVNVMKYLFTESERNEGPEVASGNVTVKRIVIYLMLGMLEGARMEQLLSLRTRDLLLSQLKRGKRGAGGGRKRRKKWANRLRRRKRRTGKSISHSVGVTGSMLYGEGEFQEESQLPLLTSRFRWGEAVKGCHQGLVIREEKERMTFKIRPEMENGRIGSLKLTVKCGIPLLSRR